MTRLIFTLFSLAAVTCNAHGMTITKSDTAPPPSDLLLAFDSTPTGNPSYLTMDRGDGYESVYGQTFKFDTNILLDKITFKVRTTQNVDHKPLLMWFGTGFTGKENSGISSLMLEPVAELPSGMGSSGNVWYLTLDVADQSLVANQTYAFMPRFASGASGGAHPEMEVGFTGAYSYDDGAAFTFGIPSGYRTILNTEMVFFLHGTAVPEPGTLSTLVAGTLMILGFFSWRHRRASWTVQNEEISPALRVKAISVRLAVRRWSVPRPWARIFRARLG